MLRRAGGAAILLALILYMIFAVSGGHQPTPAKEIQTAAVFYRDIASSWSLLAGILLFAIWFFGGFAYAGTLLATGRPLRVGSAVWLAIYLLFVWLSFQSAGGVSPGASAGRTDPLERTPDWLFLVTFLILPVLVPLMDLFMAPRPPRLRRPWQEGARA